MDLPWLPGPVRNGLTDSLAAAEAFTRLFDLALPLLTDLLARTGRRRLVDLCSGSGGPLLRLFPRLQAAGAADELVLTDVYPRPEVVPAGAVGVRYEPGPVDAAQVPRSLTGLRVIANALHHLPPEGAAAVFADAVAAGEPVLVMEALARRPGAMVAAVGVAALAGTVGPLLRPRRPSRAVLSWALPVVPLLLVWEGLVSCLRCYTAAELTALARRVAPDGWTVTHGELRSFWLGARVHWFLLAPPPADGARHAP